MYNTKDIQFNGKHDFDAESAKKFASWGGNSFSVNIFKWEMKSNGKELKRGKCVVRVHGDPKKVDAVLKECENIVKDLDTDQWDGRKNVFTASYVK